MGKITSEPPATEPHKLLHQTAAPARVGIRGIIHHHPSLKQEKCVNVGKTIINHPPNHHKLAQLGVVLFWEKPHYSTF